MLNHNSALICSVVKRTDSRRTVQNHLLFFPFSSQIKNGTWLHTAIQIDTPKTNRLPIVDIAAYDIADQNEEFGLEIGPVCFY